MLTSDSFLIPDWPAPRRVRAVSTTRIGGYGRGVYAGFNLATHVGDDPQQVARNRTELKQCLKLPGEPAWLEQVHGTDAVRLPGTCDTADASWAVTASQVCVVMTADCLPLLLCDQEGECVAAVHAGWRGLAEGVLEQAIGALPVAASRLMAWLGPAIGPRAFEVGADVRDRFVDTQAGAAAHFAVGASPGKYWADLVGLAGDRLRSAGLTRISGGHWCTHSDADRFFSYRRDGQCGRMASLIWLS